MQRQALFRPYVKYLDPDAVMPPRSRVLVLAIMWTAVLGSGCIFFARGLLEYAAAPLALTGLLATASIWRFRRGR